MVDFSAIFTYMGLLALLDTISKANKMDQPSHSKCNSHVRLGYGYASVSIITTLFSTIISHLFTSTYKTLNRIVDPKVEGSSPSSKFEPKKD